MPDLSPLPPLGSVPPVEPDLDRFAAARRGGHRRRAVRTALTGAGVAACVAVTTVAPGGAGTASIAPTSPLPTVSPTGGVEHTAGPARLSVGPGGARTEVGESPSAEPTPHPTSPPHSTDPEERPPTADPAPGEPSAPRRDPDVTGTTSIVDDDGTPCRKLSEDTSPPWCVRSRGDRTTPASARAQHVFEVCRTGDTDGTIKADPEHNGPLAVTLYQRSFEIWSVETGNRPGDITVPSGSCVRWTVRWTAVDRQGAPLPEGEYYLDWWATGQAADMTGVHGTPDPLDGIHLENGMADSFEVTVS